MRSARPLAPTALPYLPRRGFLKTSLGLVAAGFLPSLGCGQEADPGAQFLALCAVLTGYESASLDPALADTYRAALEKTKPQGLSELLARFDGGQRPALAELEAEGLLSRPAVKEAADSLILMWYTGVYDDGSGPRVAAYTDSLAWRSLTYTNPPTVCGGSVGFWSMPRTG